MQLETRRTPMMNDWQQSVPLVSCGHQTLARVGLLWEKSRRQADGPKGRNRAEDRLTALRAGTESRPLFNVWSTLISSIPQMRCRRRSVLVRKGAMRVFEQTAGGSM
jgi:hypothetical protein